MIHVMFMSIVTCFWTIVSVNFACQALYPTCTMFLPMRSLAQLEVFLLDHSHNQGCTYYYIYVYVVCIYGHSYDQGCSYEITRMIQGCTYGSHARLGDIYIVYMGSLARLGVFRRDHSHNQGCTYVLYICLWSVYLRSLARLGVFLRDHSHDLEVFVRSHSLKCAPLDTQRYDYVCIGP